MERRQVVLRLVRRQLIGIQGSRREQERVQEVCSLEGEEWVMDFSKGQGPPRRVRDRRRVKGFVQGQKPKEVHSSSQLDKRLLVVLLPVLV